MTKILSDALQVLLFFALTAITYTVLFLIDYSFPFFIILRCFILGACFLYFYKLTEYLNLLRKAKEKLNTYPSAKGGGGTVIGLCLFMLHLVIVNVGGEWLNDQLLKSDNRETVATIRDCHRSKGSEYCVYAYTAEQRDYEILYSNEPGHLKFNEYDTVVVIYYTKMPAISKLKKDWELN